MGLLVTKLANNDLDKVTEIANRLKKTIDDGQWEVRRFSIYSPRRLFHSFVSLNRSVGNTSPLFLLLCQELLRSDDFWMLLESIREDPRQLAGFRSVVIMMTEGESTVFDLLTTGLHPRKRRFATTMLRLGITSK
jgi:hypothetical protein